MKKIILILFCLFFSLNLISCHKFYNSYGYSGKKLYAGYYGNLCEPLIPEEVINIGLHNNIRFRSIEVLKEIRCEGLLQSKLNGLHPDNENADLSITSDILNLIMTYYIYKTSEKQKHFFEKHRKRQLQRLALQLTEAYWKTIVAEDHLNYVRAVKKMKEPDKVHSELSWMIRHLRNDIPYLERELGKLMGLGRNWHFTLAQIPVRSVADTLPVITMIETKKIEEYALRNRPELSNKKIPIQRDEICKIFEQFFPETNFSFTLHCEDNQHLINEWIGVGKKLGQYMLSSFSKARRFVEKDLSGDYQHEQIIAIGVMTQIRISLLNYSDKLGQFRELEKILADHMDISWKKDIKRTESKKSELHPEVEAAIHDPEIIAIKLLRDDAITEVLIAYSRLLSDIGVSPYEWGKYKFESESLQN